MPHHATITLLPLLALLLAPTAHAEVLYVAQTYDPNAGPWAWWTNTTTDQYRDASLQFNPTYYNTTGYDDNAIAFGRISVQYHVDTSGFFNGLQILLGTLNRQYETRSTWNGTDFFNQTTTITKPYCILQICTTNIQICQTFTYAAPRRGAPGYDTITTNQTCTGSNSRIPPIEHSLTLVSQQAGRTTNITTDYPFTNRTDTPSFGAIQRLSYNVVYGSEVLQPTNLTNYTQSVRITTNAIAHDTKDTEISYLFGTWATAARDAQAQHNLTSTGPDTFTKIMTSLFDNIRGAFRFVFQIFPGGAETADFIAAALTIIIGVPTFAITIFLASPPQFLLYHTVFLLCLGTIRYATSDGDVSVIWETGLLAWKKLFQWTINFALWSYDVAIRLGSLIASNNILLAAVVGTAIVTGLFALLHL